MGSHCDAGDIMNWLLKITTDEDGAIPPVDQRWHVLVHSDTIRTACGHAYDDGGDIAGIERAVKRGGITCGNCLKTVKQFKGISL